MSEVNVKSPQHTEWKALNRSHDYQDGSDGTWCVRYQHDFNGSSITVEIADWLDKGTAHMVAAAPEMYKAIKKYIAVIESIPLPDGDLTRQMRSAIAKAEAR